MSLVDRLRTDYCDCLSKRCSDEGCRVKLDLIERNHVLISGKHYQECGGFGAELCDFILFDCNSASRVRLATVELKGGDLDEDEVKKGHRQLQNGALVADEMAGGEAVAVFVPFLVKSKGINSMASRLLLRDRFKVTFRTFAEFIRVVRSNSSLRFPDG